MQDPEREVKYLETLLEDIEEFVKSLKDAEEFVKNEVEDHALKLQQEYHAAKRYGTALSEGIDHLVGKLKKHQAKVLAPDLSYFANIINGTPNPITIRRTSRPGSRGSTSRNTSSSTSGDVPPVPEDLEPFRIEILRRAHVLYQNYIPTDTNIEVDIVNGEKFRVRCPINGCQQLLSPYFGYHLGRYRVMFSTLSRHINRKHQLIN